MSIVQVQIPDSLHKSLSDLADRDGISIDRFISTAIALTNPEQHYLRLELC